MTRKRTTSPFRKGGNKKWKHMDGDTVVEIVIEADIEILVNDGSEDLNFVQMLKCPESRKSTSKKRHTKKLNNSSPSSSSAANCRVNSSNTAGSKSLDNTPSPGNMETRPRSHSAHGPPQKQKEPLLSKLLQGSHQRSHTIDRSNPSHPSPPASTRQKRYSVTIPNPNSKEPTTDTTGSTPTSTPVSILSPLRKSSQNLLSAFRITPPSSSGTHSPSNSPRIPPQSASTPCTPTTPLSPATSPTSLPPIASSPTSPNDSPRTILDTVKGTASSFKRAVSCPVINSCILLDQLLTTSGNRAPLLAPPFYASPPHSPHHQSTPSPRFPSANGMTHTRASGDTTYKVTWGGASNIGCRPENQDSYLLPPNDSSKAVLLFGVFDGHGPEGKQAANTAKKVIGDFYDQNVTFEDTDVDHSLMRNSFLLAHNAIMDKATNDFGTTAVVAALNMSSSQMYFGWVGDSKAIICRRRIPNGTPRQPIGSPREDHPNGAHADHAQANHTQTNHAQTHHAPPQLQGGNNTVYYAIELTRDHVLSIPEEMDRIYSSGGVIKSPGGMARVFIPELYSAFYGTKVGGLNMSRSLGHLYLSRFGVIPDPDYGEEGLHPNDLVILATDGLWGRMTPTEVCKFISDRPKLQNSPQEICEALIDEAKTRWGSIADNITIVVLLSSQNTT